MSIQSRPLLAIQLLISSGIIIVFVGLFMIVSSNVTYDNSINKIQNPTLIELPWKWAINYNNQGGISTGNINITMRFSSYDVFAVYTPITATVNATVYPSNSLANMYFIITEPNENLTKTLTTPSLVEERIADSRLIHSIIEMKKVDPVHFYNVTLFNFTNPRPMQVDAIFKYTNGEYFVSPVFPTSLTIESYLSKIQVDTDRDIQRQNLESEKTNGHVEGLSIIIIGLIPIGFAIEFFIERHFFDKGNSK